MELNAVIQHTNLTLEGIYIACTLAYQGKEASCMFPLESTIENIAEILKICGKNSWEQLVGICIADFTVVNCLMYIYSTPVKYCWITNGLGFLKKLNCICQIELLGKAKLFYHSLELGKE